LHALAEHWFILVHVEIEALAGRSLAAMLGLAKQDGFANADKVDQAVLLITETVDKQTRALQRIPEKMSPDLYFKRFRPYIRFFENVVYEGVEQSPINFRGETGAQSSVMASLVAFFKIPHQATALTDHLADMRRYMPVEHCALIDRIAAMSSVRPVANRDLFNVALEAVARFREVHYEWARRYIDDKVDDPRGTGGTPYIQWLAQLIRETREFCR
jgi:indoleamine 2,3-dioxygenase